MFDPAPPPEGDRYCTAPNIDPTLREALCADAVRFSESINYSCLETTEFLVETEGLEAASSCFHRDEPVDPGRAQGVEEITDVDPVQGPAGSRRGDVADLDLSQNVVRINVRATQCRITTEDPAQRVPARTPERSPLLRSARCGCAAGWRHGRHRRGDQRASFVLERSGSPAEGGRSKPRSHGRGGPWRSSDPRCRHQYPIPATVPEDLDFIAGESRTFIHRGTTDC